MLGVVAARFGRDDVVLAKATKSREVSAMRARSASSSASGTLGIVNGRIAVAPEFSIVTDMRISLVRSGFGLVVDIELAFLDGAGPSGSGLCGAASGRAAPLLGRSERAGGGGP